MKSLENCLGEIAGSYPSEFINLLRFVIPAEVVFQPEHYEDYNFVGTEHDPNDPGGETRYGLDAASHPHLDIADLTFAQAAAEYHGDTWMPLRCDEIVSGEVQLCLCDAAINCGLVRAVKWLQGAVQVTPDGNLGPLTLHATNMMDGDEVAKGINDARQDYYENQVRPSLRVLYEKGWLNRLAALRTFAAGPTTQLA